MSTYREGVAAHVVRAHRQIRDLQVLHAMHTGSLIQDTVFDNIVAILGSHATGTKRMPGSLAVPGYPFLNMCIVLQLCQKGSTTIA